jgi:hypothetical protein
MLAVEEANHNDNAMNAVMCTIAAPPNTFPTSVPVCPFSLA